MTNSGFDETKTCQGCPRRRVGCRSACAGWQKREGEKAERYRQRALWAGVASIKKDNVERMKAKTHGRRPYDA